MKTIGLIGGMSWESSLEYYRIINEVTKEKLGGFHSAKITLYSVDFAEIESNMQQARWQETACVLIDAAQRVERSGADFLLLCTNTMHKLATQIQSNIQIPLLHIADAAAEQVRAQKIKKVGLLGTQFTMEEDFYRQRLQDGYDLEVLIPGKAERQLVNRVIFDELCLGQIKPESRARYQEIIAQLQQDGAQGIILGCTEIELLVRPEDSSIPLFPTVAIHARAAVEMALA